MTKGQKLQWGYWGLDSRLQPDEGAPDEAIPADSSARPDTWPWERSRSGRILCHYLWERAESVVVTESGRALARRRLHVYMLSVSKRRFRHSEKEKQKEEEKEI
ncbi:hypothetical protein K402DRAFT_416655 [Aulographum hederae CBS 113979]|uniref:Uncharacterized protein n=1 Tax=Aulographum hederae CBS 113979 TaxID=1176131 RepID=A0A6G1HDM2_9PEZI|nr:hypothetical protein K402DRAFT_416655 [Aulographum hederae CBS 113979]